MKKFLVYKMGVLLAVLGIAFNSHSAVLKVTTVTDGGAGSLRNQVAAAAAGDTILVDVSGTMIVMGSAFNINKALTIIGPSAAHFSINGNSFPFIISTAGTAIINIEGVRFTNPAFLCGPYFSIEQFASVNIRNCVFEGNIISGDGAAIRMANSAQLRVSNSSFFNCQSSTNGGAIYAGALNFLNATNCTFSGCSATNGGAIYTGGNTELVNNTFINNTASANGHAVATAATAIVLLQNNIITDLLPAKLTNLCFSGGGPNWNNNGGNIYSTVASYAFITPGAGDQYNIPIGSIGLRTNPVLDGYGLKYYTLISSGGAAVDAGNAGALVPAVDGRRAPRILVGTSVVKPDAGACEFTPFTVTSLVGAQSFSNKVTALNASINPPPYYMDFDIAAPGTASIGSTVTISKTNVFIDGYTQESSKVYGPGAAALTVTPSVLPNILSGPAGGIVINIAGSDCRIEGLDFTNAGVGIGCNGSSNISINGNRFHVLTLAGISLNGCNNVVIGARNHWARNLIGGNTGKGIQATTCTNINIQGNFIGVNSTGTAADANAAGVVLTTCAGGNIGGNHFIGEGNIISGNLSHGMELVDSDNLIILGNYVGLEYKGNTAIANTTNGIFINSSAASSSLKIGLAGIDYRNYICNNDPTASFGGAGIHILNHTSGSIQIYNNYLGLNVSSIAGPNATGVKIMNSSGISMGDGTWQKKNIISGNAGIGIYMDGVLCNGNYFNKNFIGIKNDNSPAPNSSIGFHVVNGAVNNTIINHVISNCGSGSVDGVHLNGAGSGNAVSGNFIGTDSTGTIAMANYNGIQVQNSGAGTIMFSNVVSGNVNAGILIDNTHGVEIGNSMIGVNLSATSPLGNNFGVFVQNSNMLNMHGNIVGGSTTDGLLLGASSNATIKSNYFGTNSSGINLGNKFGISVYFVSSGTIIGGFLPSEFNVFAHNVEAGVNVQRESYNIGILGNTFFQNVQKPITLNSGGTTPLPNDLNDADISGPAIPNVGNDGQNYPFNTTAIKVATGANVIGEVNVDDVSADYLIQAYKVNPGNVDPTGYGEGDTLVGSVTVSAPGVNTFSFIIPVAGLALGDIISTTCTKVVGVTYSTSEFSDTISVRSGIGVTIIDSADVSCFGAADGFAQVSISGGTGPYTYAWYTGASVPLGVTTDSVNTLGPGTYYCIVTDIGCGCSDTSNLVTITEPPALIVTGAVTPPTCAGTCDGIITLTASGGTTPYMYSIDNGTTFFSSNIFSSLCAGSYQFVAKDTNGCTTPTTGNTINVIDPPALTGVPTFTNETCFGLNDGTITLAGGGGVPAYQYSIDGGTTYFASGTFIGLAPGTYTWFVKDAAGCTVTSSVTITAGTLVTLSAGADFTVCSTSSSFTLPGSSSTTITWSTTNGTGTFSSTSTAITNYTLSPADTSLPVLVFVLTTGVVGSCGPLHDTVLVTISTGLDPAFSYSASSYCSNDPSVIPTAATVGGYYDVVGGLGVTINTATGELFPNLCIPGTYQIYHKFTAPCVVSDTVTVTINAAPNVNIIPQHLGCYGDTIYFVGTPAGGTYSGISFGLNATTGQWINLLSGVGFQTVTYTYTDPGTGCTNFDTNKIFIRPAPVLSFIGLSGPYCPSDGPFTVSGNPAGGIIFLNGVAQGTTSFTYDPATIGTDTIAYFYQDPITTCYSYLSVNVSIVGPPPAPILSATAPFDYCDSSPTSIAVSNPATSVNWYADAGLTNLIVSGVSILTSSLPGGTNTVYVANLVGSTCTSPSVAFTYTNYDESYITFGGPYVNCADAPVTINATIGTGFTYQWIPDSTLSDITILNPVATPSQTTTYFITAIPSALPTCTIYDSVQVVVQPCDLDNVTNAFTPDGDGINDTWIINGIQLHPNNQVTIFNRWGNKMIEIGNYDNITNVWDGKYKGSLVAAGTYYFIIQFFDDGQQKAGWIQINY